MLITIRKGILDLVIRDFSAIYFVPVKLIIIVLVCGIRNYISPKQKFNYATRNKFFFFARTSYSSRVMLGDSVENVGEEI